MSYLFEKISFKVLYANTCFIIDIYYENSLIWLVYINSYLLKLSGICLFHKGGSVCGRLDMQKNKNFDNNRNYQRHFSHEELIETGYKMMNIPEIPLHSSMIF